MKLAEILAVWRREIKDSRRPYLVPHEDGVRFANEAQCEAARRARLLVDSVSDICQIPVSAAQNVVDLDPKVISIRRARMASKARPIAKRRVRDMDEQFPGWDASNNPSNALVIVTDYGTNQLFLHHSPAEDDALLLTVTREPLCDMSADDDTPEIAPRYHEGLIPWMKHRAYLIDDSDLYDPKQAERALAQFEGEFGKAISAVDERFEFENYDDIGER